MRAVFRWDHISKMRQGKRLPQDTEKIRKLIMALQCSEKVTRNLFSLYKIERMGSEEWSCMQEIKKILESTNSFLEPGGENEKKSSGKMREECRKQDIYILNSRTEVLAFLEKMLPQCGQCIADVNRRSAGGSRRIAGAVSEPEPYSL